MPRVCLAHGRDPNPCLCLAPKGKGCSREGNGPQGEEVRRKGSVDTALAGHIQASGSLGLEGKAK